ncbi:hypothetical protein O0I10_002174 [Lichtheimia ornata]|uniref:Protein BIG1 n=1 Tax=Lichtheimia ornata TaxID=688661 RepID=A0AAD7VBB6_9FUNG|nr:uncharacterized protein O0I10_002174 [Lichtheimia ornata]KAJ8661846.1 hypothetical protein O0I10_002174 [Lichtheimia ornata]
MKIYAAALLSSLASAVVAFESTVPCLMWSPKDYFTPTMDAIEQFIVGKDDAVTTIWSSLSPDICDAKLIAVVDQPGIHVNDFSRSEAFAAIKQYRKDAATRTEFEYIADSVNVNQLAQLISEECEGNMVQVAPRQGLDIDQDARSPTVAVMSLPSTSGSVAAMQENDASVDEFIKSVQEYAQDDYAVIYTSSSAKQSSSHMKKRSMFERRAPASDNSAPIFAKYQLFSPGIFMAIGVSIVVVFIVAVGVSWLVNIQTPIRFEGKPKKN